MVGNGNLYKLQSEILLDESEEEESDEEQSIGNGASDPSIIVEGAGEKRSSSVSAQNKL